MPTNSANRHKAFHRHPAHPPPVRRHNEPVILHVTVCCLSREGLLTGERQHAALLDAWRQATHWRTGEYMVMPDHIHFFCAPGIAEYPPIRRWVGYWKRVVGTVDPILKRVFQDDCWDTQVRDIDHYNEKLSYMRRNPERKQLVAQWEDWPYRGRVFDVHWW